jgi:hypothetical protein
MDILPRDEKIFWDSPIDLSGKVSFWNFGAN